VYVSLADDVLELIGQIYEAGVEPRLWDATLARLGERFRANGGILATTVGGSNQLSFSSEFGGEPEWQDLYNREFHKPELNPCFPRSGGCAPVGRPPTGWCCPNRTCCVRRSTTSGARPRTVTRIWGW
jgi:hypothetical protein